MDTPPDLQRLRRRAARGSAHRPPGGGTTVAPGRRGRNPGTETRVTTRSRGVDDPTIFRLERAAQATSSPRGRTA